MESNNGTATLDAEQNGTTNRVESVVTTKKPRPKKAQDEVDADEMYAEMGNLCDVKKLSLKKETVKGTFTASVDDFPELDGEAVTDSAEAGFSVVFKPANKIDGAKASAKGYAEGENGKKLAEKFRKLKAI